MYWDVTPVPDPPGMEGLTMGVFFDILAKDASGRDGFQPENKIAFGGNRLIRIPEQAYENRFPAERGLATLSAGPVNFHRNEDQL
jgi:hypothetical protein